MTSCSQGHIYQVGGGAGSPAGTATRLVSAPPTSPSGPSRAAAAIVQEPFLCHLLPWVAAALFLARWLQGLWVVP